MTAAVPVYVVAEWANGHRAYVELLSPPEGAPEEICEGIVRRNLLITEGACPCGATFEWPTGDTPQRVHVWHEADCPAGDEYLRPLIEAWQANG